MERAAPLRAARTHVHVIDTSEVATALASVRASIARAVTGKNPSSVVIVAVTKGFGPDAVRAALAAGLSDVGENYYQEAASKFSGLEWPPGVTRHFIGRVQTNKARRIAALFDVVQTLEDADVASILDAAAAAQARSLDVLVQVNASSDQRQGVAPNELARFVADLKRYSHLRVRGLMTLGPRDPAATAAAFARVRSCFDALRAEQSPSFDTLSMGMSDDLELAVATGSTMLRIGTALFGSRPPKSATV